MKTDSMKVINLTTDEIEHTIRATSKNLTPFTNKHVVLLVDNNTKFGRIVRAQEALKGIAMTTKVVDRHFTNQWMLTHRDFNL